MDSQVHSPTDEVTFSYPLLGVSPAEQVEPSEQVTLQGLRGDHIFETIRNQGTFYEPDLLEAIAKQVPGPYDLVIDVGACIGNHAVFFAKILGASVLCVEPSPTALQFLRANLAKNGLAERTRIVEAAAAETSGQVFLTQSSPANLGMTRVSETPVSGSEDELPVPAMTLDEIVERMEWAKCRRVSLIKIDVEGYEERVLAGATGVMTNHAPAIAIELATRDAMYRVHSMLAVYGYTMSGPFCATPTYLFISPTLATNEAILKLIRSDVGELKLLGGEFRSLLRLQEDLQSRLQNAEQRNQATDDKVKAAGQRIAQLEKSLGEVHHTARYRIGDAMVLAAQPSIHTLKLPVRLWRIYSDKTKQHAQEAANRAHAARATVLVRKRLQAFDHDFEKFVRLLKKENYPYFVVMFSGTTYIQDIRAKRPIRLARSLLKMDVPVLFNFHRWGDAEHIPPYDTPTLFQSPIDLTPKLLRGLASADLGDTLRILIVSYPYPTVPRFLNRMNANGWVTLYDCRDDWEEFERVGAAKWYSPVVERYVVNNCDFTCCVSRVLQQKIQSMTTTREVRLSPNAYDEAFLKPGYVHRPGNTVKIGYFGHLSPKWFDWDSLIEIARQRPNYQFEIIGHSAPDDLPLPSNVALFGPKTHAQICDIASTWHVGIIPFKVGRLADSVDPIKIYEYFALQLPVVSFRIPQISDYPYTATIETIDQFIAALDNAVQTKGDPATFKRFLQRNTWNIRAKSFLDLANEALALRQCEKTFQVDHSAKAAS